MRKLDNVKVAKELLKIADMVEAYRDTDPIMDVVKDKKFDINVLKLKEQHGVILRLVRYFKDSHKDKIDAFEKFKEEQEAKIKVLKAQIEDAEKPIKDEFSAWSKVGESKYNKLSKAFLENAHKDAEMGGNLEELASAIDDFLVMEETSEQDSYKIKYEMLVTALHNAGEYKKYTDILDGSSNKIFTYLKTGLKYLDKKVDDWKTDLKDVAEKRNLSWKDLLKYTFTKEMRWQEKESGIVDVIKSVASITNNMFKSFSKTISKMYDAVTREEKKTDRVYRDLDSMVNNAMKIAMR